MRFSGLLLAIWAAVAYAQSQYNAINTPNSGFNAVAGQSITITWTNPSSGTVSIRLTQGSDVTPGSGVLLVSSIDASAQTATFTIPSDVNQAAYNFEIIDNSNPSNPNFSSPFTISGGTLTGSSSASSTMTSSSTSSGSTSSTSGTSSTSSNSSSTSSSSSSSSSSSTDSSSSSASHSSTSSASRTSASASSTSVASTNGAAYVKAGGLLAFMAGAVAVF